MRTDPKSLAELLPSWQIGLQAQHLASDTIRHYIEGARLCLRWCESAGTTPELTKPNVQAFISHLFDNGAAPATARARWSALKRLSCIRRCIVPCSTGPSSPESSACTRTGCAIPPHHAGSLPVAPRAALWP